MVGSEHLALLLRGAGPGRAPRRRRAGRGVPDRPRASWAPRPSAPTRSSTTSSASTARSTASRVHDFTKVDAALERLLETGLRPVIELSFMPRDAGVGPGPDRVRLPRDHLAAPRPRAGGRRSSRRSSATSSTRFGRDEVARWPFEVWNEPNLRGLLDAARSPTTSRCTTRRARAVKRGRSARSASAARRPRRPAGSTTCSSTAATAGVPVDFLSTHTYGMPPLDLRPIAARYGARRHPAAVDRVGHLADPRRAGQRQRLGRAARRPRHALGGRPAGRARRTG